MKIYSVEILIAATAYVVAESENEAAKKAQYLKLQSLEVPEGTYGQVEISGKRFDDPDIPELSVSPAMTVHEVNVKADFIEEIEGNLHIHPYKWLKEQFQFEWCAECGRDHRHHTAVPVMGNWFARCDREPVIVDDELVINPEGYSEDSK